jgi:hypothetical protein
VYLQQISCISPSNCFRYTPHLQSQTNPGKKNKKKNPKLLDELTINKKPKKERERELIKKNPQKHSIDK